MGYCAERPDTKPPSSTAAARRIRSSALNMRWDHSRVGRSDSQVDVARTWLDFTVTPFRALAVLRIELTEPEQHSLYKYWHYIAYLLGLADGFYRDVTDHDSARELGHLFDLTIGARRTTNSRALTCHGQRRRWSSWPRRRNRLMRRAEFSDLIHGILRAYLRRRPRRLKLGIPLSSAAPFLVMIALANSETRRWQTFTPSPPRRASGRTLPDGQADHRSPDIPGGRPTSGTHAPAR